MSTVFVVVPVHPQKGESAQVCKARAESGEGAFSFDEFGTACWAIYGKEIKINPFEHSIEEGFRITNLNFRAGSGGAASAGKPSQLPGPKSNTLGASSGYFSGV